MEEIEKKDSSGHTFERAQTNTAVIASRMRRTHYAAYVAGKLSMSEDIGDKFKSWMHNAAANGAITLGEAIDSLLVQKRAGADDESLRVLKVFRNGAFEDAVRFIALAENFDKSSVLTAYK